MAEKSFKEIMAIKPTGIVAIDGKALFEVLKFLVTKPPADQSMIARNKLKEIMGRPERNIH